MEDSKKKEVVVEQQEEVEVVDSNMNVDSAEENNGIGIELGTIHKIGFDN